MSSEEAREDSIEIPDEPTSSVDPYEILEVSQDATAEQIKTAYRKTALKHHPDKATDEDANTAKEKFQQIAFAYAILSDPRRRERYDKTGSTSEILDDDEDFDWNDFFRSQYQEITKDSIESFSKTYKGSEQERTDLLENYSKHKGKMDLVYETTILSNVLEDDDRFGKIIDDAIASGEVEAYKEYTDEPKAKKTKRIQKAQREAEEASEVVAEQPKAKKSKKKADGPGNIDDLAALIHQRQKQRSHDFLDNLEAKYSGKPGGKGKSGKRKLADEVEEPPEEAFEAVGNRVKKAKSDKRFTKKYGEGHKL